MEDPEIYDVEQSDFEMLEICLENEDACNLNAAVYQMISEGHQLLAEPTASHFSRSERPSSLGTSESEKCRQSDFSQCGWRKGDSNGSEMGDFGSDAPIDLIWLLHRCDSDLPLLTMVMEAFEDQGNAHCSGMSSAILDGEYETLFASAVSSSPQA